MKTYELSRQKNIRDIGGLTNFEGKSIKYGLLIRGGSLANISEEDADIIKTLHLTDIVDFRGEEEYINKPDYRFEGVSYHNFPVLEMRVNEKDKKKDDANLLWFLNDHTCGHEHIKDCYHHFTISKVSIKAYKDFFSLLDGKRKIYFHCSQGKDRAGFAAYLIEIALGISEGDALKDYLYSNIAMEKRADMMIEYLKSQGHYSEEYKQNLLDVFMAREEYLYEAINVCNEHYGSVINFITNILEVDIAKLRGLYLS